MCPDGNRSCVEFRSYPAEVQSHHHDYHQIVLGYRGRLDIDIGGQADLVERGRGALIAVGQEHAFAAAQDNKFLVIDMPSTVAAALGVPHGAFRTRCFPVGEAVCHLVGYFTSASQTPRWTTDLQSTWSALLLRSIGIGRDCTPLDRSEIILRRSHDFMRSTLSEAVNSADIARAAGVSQTRLFAVFRQRLNTTPKAVLTRLRLDEAHRLLVFTHLSIAEIAFRTGHSDQSGLTRRMRQIDGVTPAEVRQR